MRLHWSIMNIAAGAALAMAGLLVPAAAEPSAKSVTVTYQCQGEPVKTFKYETGSGHPQYRREAEQEARWYWERRPDHGQGCRVLSDQ